MNKLGCEITEIKFMNNFQKIKAKEDKSFSFYNYLILFFTAFEEHPQFEPQLPSSFFLKVFLIIP